MNIYDLWFSSVNISNRIKVNIIGKFKNTEEIWAKTIYNKDSIKILSDPIKNRKLNAKLKEAWNKGKLQSMVEKSYKKGIKSLNLNSELYPDRLKNYEDSPAVLFYMGDISKLDVNLNVAIVGSRNCSVYGKNSAEIISREVARNKINIISGMARGIDTFAHRGCISTDGYTCAVLGSGIDIVYPRDNEHLYNDIFNRGCIISEFVPGTPPVSYNFPMRNRIISGLSDVVVVIEAGEKSGALITAHIALDQGKTVMAVPGSIFSDQSKGTNKLIKDGAYPFTKFDDLFQLLKTEYKIKSMENRSILDRNMKIIFDIIEDTPIHVDDIFRKANIDIKQLYGLLFELQLKNEIVCLSGNYYVRVPDKNNIIN